MTNCFQSHSCPRLSQLFHNHGSWYGSQPAVITHLRRGGLCWRVTRVRERESVRSELPRSRSRGKHARLQVRSYSVQKEFQEAHNLKIKHYPVGENADRIFLAIIAWQRLLPLPPTERDLLGSKQMALICSCKPLIRHRPQFPPVRRCPPIQHEEPRVAFLTVSMSFKSNILFFSIFQLESGLELVSHVSHVSHKDRHNRTKTYQKLAVSVPFRTELLPSADHNPDNQIILCLLGVPTPSFVHPSLL